MNAAGTGCSSGQLLTEMGDTGLPNRVLTAATMALIGFHAANHCNAVGIVAIGTNALLTKVSGNTTMNPTPMTASGDRTVSPMSVPIQIIADANEASSTSPS